MVEDEDKGEVKGDREGEEDGGAAAVDGAVVAGDMYVVIYTQFHFNNSSLFNFAAKYILLYWVNVFGQHYIIITISLSSLL